MKSISQVCTEVLRDYGGLQVLVLSIETTDLTGKRCHPLLGSVLEPQTSSSETCERERGLIDWAWLNVSANTAAYGRRFYRSKDPTNSITQNTANPLVYTNMVWLGDGSHRGQGCQAWTAVGLPPRYPEREKGTGETWKGKKSKKEGIGKSRERTG